LSASVLGLLTPTLARIERFGESISLTIKSATLFRDTSVPLKGADCTLLLVAIAVNGVRPFAAKTDWRPRQLAQEGPKLDHEIDFNYGSRLTINSQ
jgi:hypothetical protein